MQFKSYKPVEELRPYIKQFMYIKEDAPLDPAKLEAGDKSQVHTIFPNWGMFGIVRNAKLRVGDIIVDRGPVMTGPSTAAFECEVLEGWFEGIAVEFELGGMHALMSTDMAEMYNAGMNSQELMDGPFASLSVDMIQHATPMQAKLILESFMLGRLHTNRRHNQQMLLAIAQQATKARTKLAIGELAKTAQVSERQLSRIFRAQTGLTPKEYLRMLRWHLCIQELQSSARKGKRTDISEVAYKYGYYDSSHMAAEFRNIGCESPARFKRLGLSLKPDFTVFFG